jgi:beta-lactamase class A
MKREMRYGVLLVLALGLLVPAAAKSPARQSPPQPAASPRLQRIVDDAARAALERFREKGLAEKNLAVTVIDLTDPARPAQASFRGAEPIYPASVVKLFYLAAAHRWLEDGRLKESEEFSRGLRDMIVASSNDATHYVLDSLTGVSNGAELPPAELKKWGEKRNAVNRYFARLGYAVGAGGINVNQKPWCEGPYGRERQFLGPKFENRNKLTTDATARLVKGRLDEHRPPRRRLRGTARRSPPRPRHLHHRRGQRARHHPDHRPRSDKGRKR